MLREPLLLLGSLVGLLGCSHSPTVSERPNVILVVLDTVRRDHLSCYGYERPTTPELERLASDSAVFERATSAAPWTLPSHASMFTGLPSSQHHAHHEHLGLDASRTTMAESLGASGYETFAVSNNPWVSERTGLTQGFDGLVEPWRSAVAKESFALNVFPDEEKHGLPDAGAEASLVAIEDWMRGRDAERPFFLFVNLIEAHAYYAPPGDYRNRFTSRELSSEDVREINFAFLRQAHGNRLTDRTTQTIRDLYDGELAYLDAWVGRFLSSLRSVGEYENSLLILTSDHGEAFGEHRRCDVTLVDHQLSLFDELLAVPLLVRFPASHAAASLHGTRIAKPVSSLDLLPTVLEVVGLQAQGLPGLSLTNPAISQERTLVSEYFRPLAHLDTLQALIGDPARIECLADRRMASLRTATHKLTLDSEGEASCFDLLLDPAESQPLGEIPRELMEAARLHLESMRGSFDVPPPAELGEAQQAALRSLGYL